MHTTKSNGTVSSESVSDHTKRRFLFIAIVLAALAAVALGLAIAVLVMLRRRRASTRPHHLPLDSMAAYGDDAEDGFGDEHLHRPKSNFSIDDLDDDE